MQRVGRSGDSLMDAILHATRHPQHEPPVEVEGAYAYQKVELFHHN